MEVYRITHINWAGKLKASGRAARWNSDGKFVIYTASSRALACLENVVHRSGEGLNSLFKIVTIDIPEDVSVEKVSLEDLSQNWFEFNNYPECQKVGNLWLGKAFSCVLEVPSAVIPDEKNYILNTNHQEFEKVSIKNVDDFKFDPRLT